MMVVCKRVGKSDMGRYYWSFLGSYGGGFGTGIRSISHCLQIGANPVYQIKVMRIDRHFHDGDGMNMRG